MGLSEEVWDYCERQAAPKRPSRQSTEEAIYFFDHADTKDETNLWATCVQLAYFIDNCKQRDKEQSHREPLPASSNVSQVPWALSELADVKGEILQHKFGQRTSRFQTQQDAECFMSGLSATDYFHTTITDVASHYDISVSAAMITLLTGQITHISSANLVIKPSTIRISEDSVLTLSKVQANFNDPNFPAYKTLPQNVRQIYRPAGGRGPTVKQAEVYTFVVVLGRPPGRKGKDKIWWETIAAPKWNERRPDRPLKWNSLRKIYQNAQKANATVTKTLSAKARGKTR